MSSQVQNNGNTGAKYSVNLIDRMITAIVRPDARDNRLDVAASASRAALVRSGLLSLYNSIVKGRRAPLETPAPSAPDGTPFRRAFFLDSVPIRSRQPCPAMPLA